MESGSENQLGYCGRRLLILLIHAARVPSSGTPSTGSHSCILGGIGVIPNLDVSNTFSVISRILDQSAVARSYWSSNDPPRDPYLVFVLSEFD